MKASFFYRSCNQVLQYFFKLVYKHKVYFADGHFTCKGGAILASNHASFYDPPLVAISWKEPIAFLARRTLFHNFLLRALITRLNAYPVSSTDLGSLKLACSLLEEGKKILIFPEGTRTKKGDIQHFRNGVTMLAERAQCPIIPIYVHGSFEAWPYKKRFPKFFGKKTACVFGKPIFLDQFAHMEKRERQQKITEHLQNEIMRLREWYLHHKA